MNSEKIILYYPEGNYYRPNMGGSFSFKVVLPSLFPNDPELDYHHLGIGFYSEPLGEDYEDLISDKVDPEGKEPFELFCLNFMYNVLCKYGNELSDFSAAAYDFCNAYQYIVRDENDNILFEGEIDWDLREIID